MWRMALVACVACSSSDPQLADGPSVGETCFGPPSADLTQVPTGDASLYSAAYVSLHDDYASITLLPPGSLTLNNCALSWTGEGDELSWSITLNDDPALRAYDVASNEVHVWAAGIDAESGSVTLTGYDADRHSLCGSVDATVPGGGRLVGAFLAHDYCE